MFSLMPDEEAAQAIKATVNYYLYGANTALEGVAGKMFEIMRADIDRNNEKYQEVCSRNEKNGKKGGKTEENPLVTQWVSTGNPVVTKL